MKISVISFTKKGKKIAEKIKDVFGEKYNIEIFSMEKGMQLKEWTKKRFEIDNSIIFIGAVGIGVRSIAPFVKSKISDPSVIVIDELGKYVIPILSGHIGGGNSLALELSRITGGIPVITTATDINNKISIDVFAVKNNLIILDYEMAKYISSRVINDLPIGLISEVEIQSDIPEEIKVNETDVEYGVVISNKTNYKPFPKTLNLYPKNLILGIGCKRNKSLFEIENAVIKALKENKLSFASVCRVSSIDIKEDEIGITKFAHKYNLDTDFFSEKELNSLDGEFSKSEFVKEVTGVDSVCERAAIKASQGGRLIVKKYIQDGITIAVAEKDWSVKFE